MKRDRGRAWRSPKNSQQNNPALCDDLWLGNTNSLNYPATAEYDWFRISSGVPFSSNFTSPSAVTADASTLLSWQFNEGTGTTLSDDSGNGVTGTLYNGTTWNNVCSPPTLNIQKCHTPHPVRINNLLT